MADNLELPPLPPVLVAERFPALLAELLALLKSLTPTEWQAPTVCDPWTVKDLVLHLLGDEIGILAQRDRLPNAPARVALPWEELLPMIDAQNDLWVKALQRTSVPVLLELLKLVGNQSCDYFASLDPLAMGTAVEWVSPDPVPVWVDIAREFTERWHHQQQIRDALGKPALLKPYFLQPVLDTFVLAIPRTYREVAALRGTIIALVITGEAGGHWLVRREALGWQLYQGREAHPKALLEMPADLAWRVFTRVINKSQALRQVSIKGDYMLATKVLDTVSIIA